MRFKNSSDLCSSFFLWLIEIYYMIEFSMLRYSLSSFYKSLVYFAILFFVAFLYFRKQYYISEVKWIICFLLIGTWSAYFTKEFTVLLSCMCIIAAIDKNKEQLFKQLFIIKLFCMLLLGCLSLAGVIDNVQAGSSRMSSFLEVALLKRYAMGFIHPNDFGICCFELVILYILGVKKGKNLKRKDYYGIMIYNAAAFLICGSRTSFLCIFLLVLFMKIQDLGIIKKNVFNKLAVLFMAVFAVFFTYGIEIIYAHMYSLFAFLNRLLQTRIIYNHLFIKKFGIHLYGSEMADFNNFWAEGVNSAWISLDSGYGTLVIKQGLVITIVLIALYYKYMNYEKNASLYLGCVLSVIVCYAVSEKILLFITKNATLFFLSALIKDDIEDGVLNEE